jgi:DNA-binding NtrC family response regulator
MRVLIVDDGEAGGRLAAYLKQAYGAETFLAKSIEDGFKLRRDIEGLDFIVYDLSFPNSTREQSIDCIPMMSDGIPLFVFTGYEEKEIIQKSIAAGAMDCFLKGDNGTRASTRSAPTRRHLHPQPRQRERCPRCSGRRSPMPSLRHARSTG